MSKAKKKSGGRKIGATVELISEPGEPTVYEALCEDGVGSGSSREDALKNLKVQLLRRIGPCSVYDVDLDGDEREDHDGYYLNGRQDAVQKCGIFRTREIHTPVCAFGESHREPSKHDAPDLGA